MSVFITLALAFSASFFYVGAAVFLKQWPSLPPLVAVAGILGCLALACLAELHVFRRAGFAEVVILIITLEVGMAVLLSRLAFGEVFTLRDGFGMALLVMGAAVLLWHPEKQPVLETALPKAGQSRLI
jgi:drug/metabolite transporter (DMT)-like permease